MDYNALALKYKGKYLGEKKGLTEALSKHKFQCEKEHNFEYNNAVLAQGIWCRKCEDKTQARKEILEMKEEKIKDKLYDKRLCNFAGCKTRPIFGKSGSKIKEYCIEHKPADYVNVVSKTCIFAGCKTQACFGKSGSKIKEYCVEHKPTDYVVVINKTCVFAGCKTRPSFGKSGSKIAEYCIEHKPTDYVDVVSKTCVFAGCKTRPNFGKSGSKIKEYCIEHKPADYVDVVSKTCIFAGCKKQPSFGKIGSKIKEYCIEHKPADYVDIVHKTCIFAGCKTLPCFGKIGSKIREYCAAHKPTDYVNVADKTCVFAGCKTRPSFGKSESKINEYCAAHAPADYVDIKNKKCMYAGCKTRASYGKLFSNKIHCATHKLPNEYSNNNPTCTECKKQPLWTDEKNNLPLRCDDHKKANDMNVIERKCSSCGLMFIIRQDGMCNDCSDFHVKKVHHAKENHIKDVLIANDIKFVHDKRPDNGCGRQRPDFVIDAKTHMIIIEVDEDQHRNYACECEQARMINLFQEYGGTPVCFVRYNPDLYTDHLGKKITTNNGREKRLVEAINALTIHQPKDPLTVLYLYYDGDDGTNKVLKMAYEF